MTESKMPPLSPPQCLLQYCTPMESRLSVPPLRLFLSKHGDKLNVSLCRFWCADIPVKVNDRAGTNNVLFILFMWGKQTTCKRDMKGPPLERNTGAHAN